MKFLVFIVLYFAYTAVSANLPSVCPNIITRNEWGARSSSSVDHLLKPVEYVIVHHTVTPECTTKSECIDRVFNTQVYHMEDLLFDDIGYNFLIGSDGNVYEGIGWSKIGAHTIYYNSKSIGIGYIGNFDDKYATDAAIEAGKKLLDCGVALGVFNDNVKLVAARQIQQTRSPGLRLFKQLRSWRRWVASP